MPDSASDKAQANIRSAMALLPGGDFLLTAAHEGRRSGLIARSVQPCADEPILLAVCVRRGHLIEPLIRDSHSFGVCEINSGHRLVRRMFDPEQSAGPEPSVEPEGEETDPFAAFDVTVMETGSPVLRNSSLVFDCEVVRHFDLEADHEMFVGLVVAARRVRGQS